MDVRRTINRCRIGQPGTPLYNCMSAGNIGQCYVPYRSDVQTCCEKTYSKPQCVAQMSHTFPYAYSDCVHTSCGASPTPGCVCGNQANIVNCCVANCQAGALDSDCHTWCTDNISEISGASCYVADSRYELAKIGVK